MFLIIIYEFLVGRIDFNDLHFEKRKYSPISAYGQSKLANVLFTNQLAKIIKV